jgi:hypothetical protein
MFKINKANIIRDIILLFLAWSCQNNDKSPPYDLILAMDNAIHEKDDPALADSLCEIILAADSIPPSFYSRAIYVKRMNGKWDEGILIANVGLGKEVGRADSLRIMNQLMEIFAESGRINKAIEHGIILSKKLQSSDGRRFGVLCKLGDLHFDNADYDSALYYHKAAYRTAKERKDQLREQWAANELYFDYLELGLLDSANHYFKKYELYKLHGAE